MIKGSSEKPHYNMEDSLSSVKIITSTKGVKTYEVKVCHENPDLALIKAKELSEELDEYCC